MDLQKDAKALGLKSPVANPAAVRRAYIQKAKAAHPDAGGTKQEFQNIQAAYERLGTQVDTKPRSTRATTRGGPTILSTASTTASRGQ